MSTAHCFPLAPAAPAAGRTNAAIDQVAHDAGYASRSSFVRAFKAAFRLDPSEYRTRERAKRREARS